MIIRTSGHSPPNKESVCGQRRSESLEGSSNFSDSFFQEVLEFVSGGSLVVVVE